MPTPARVNVSEVIDRSPVSAFQAGVMTLCGICLMLDGFDVQAIGYVAPAIKHEWLISDPVLGRVVSAALVGVLVGSLFLSMLADKIGRRPILVGSCLFFSITTLLTARAQSVDQLLIIRFIAGIGLGAIMPNVMALVSEYTPRRLRVTMMMVVSNGFTAGAAIGGFIAAWLIPTYGWRSVFYCGGAIPLLIGAAMLFALPESIQFMVVKGKDGGKIAKWLRHIDPAAAAGGASTQYVVPESKESARVPFVQLFHEGRAVGTILIWLTYFMNLLNLYLLAGWLPTVANAMGYSTATSARLGAMEQAGGMVGALILSWFVHRMGFVPVLVTCFSVACVNIALIGKPGLSLTLLFVVVCIAGFGVVGGQAGVNALTGTFYPTRLRSTGLGAGLGIGRIGSIVGPLVAGELRGRHWSNQELFYAAAVPALVSAIVMIAMHWVLKPQAISASAQSEVAVP
jgi:MFS transporter, AAHS family, 4-hydroxybenzoate transporter